MVDRPKHAHRETGAGKRVAPEDVFGNAELRADAPHLVLEEAAKRLDHLERHDLGKPADVVVGLDAGRRLALARPGLDDVGVDRSLHQEWLCRTFAGEALHPRDSLKATDELFADDRALAFGIINARELPQKPLRGIEVRQPQPRPEG